MKRLASVYERRLMLFANQFYQYTTAPKYFNRLERVNFLEGLVSNAWQLTCHFNRTHIILSSQGAILCDGSIIAPRSHPIGNQESRIIYEAKQYSKVGGRPKNTITKNVLHYSEPTWADPNVYTRVVSGVKPNNEAIVTGSVSSYYNSFSHLQTIRNACAHLNINNLNDVRALSPLYVASYISHPTGSLLWTERASGDPVFIKILGDLIEYSKLVT